MLFNLYINTWSSSTTTSFLLSSWLLICSQFCCFTFLFNRLWFWVGFRNTLGLLLLLCTLLALVIPRWRSWSWHHSLVVAVLHYIDDWWLIVVLDVLLVDLWINKQSTLDQVHDGLLDSLACLGWYLETLDTELLFVVLQHLLKGYSLLLLVDLVT